MTKKRKLSGLSGSELVIAYNALLKLKKTFIYTAIDDSTGDPNATKRQELEDLLEEQTNHMITLVHSKIDDSQVVS